MKRLLPIVLFLAAACASAPPQIDDVNRVLDDWHKAAADADEARYFRYAAPEFVFLGTDGSERWDLASFRAFAHPYFAKGKAWTFVAHDRHIQPSPREDVAWFDEKLDSASYGECRGSGVLRYTRDGWKIAQYNLTIPIPNDLAKSVVQMIREGKRK
jgi:ketosteroid isomerase-like protein